ncbi:hypothetical protein GGTG_06511 [Gaeumannomyces tritici R3-111a-1]|uniref:Uncharacterized protein n=1 Tax=Gaeumannomyces tritici (strain R3-111a-1) TaxID=644352 RepID=J3NZ11_GAET3|nr:hypothetical protein GGTG_06511 [Gaeumannomyces tritici R3-111a-1]EJT76594.1 hypothetical protein GGTG_06511 [Gaeumannomyces tritici R3-111a-1]
MPSLVGLKRSLPRSGMKYADYNNILSRGSRDRKVAQAIMTAAAAATSSSSSTITTTELTRWVVEPHLAQIFRDAADLFAARNARGGESPAFSADFFHLMEALRPIRAWTMALKEPIFIELFAKLSAARAAWRASPQHPHDEDKHCELAKAIDQFNLVAGGNKTREWADGGLELYELVGGLAGVDADSSSGEDDDQPFLQQADDDVDMGDGEQDSHLATIEGVTEQVEEMGLCD